MARTKRIRSGDAVPVRFTARERKLLEDVVGVEEYVERMRPWGRRWNL